MDKHYSVMKKEAIELLGIKENGIYVDGTLGRGGHSEEILKRIGDGKLYAFDLDEEAIKESKEFLNNDSRLHIFHNNFCIYLQLFYQSQTLQATCMNYNIHCLWLYSNCLCSISKCYKYIHKF